MASLRIRELEKEIDKRRVKYSKLKNEAEKEYREIIKLAGELKKTKALTRLVTMGLIEWKNGMWDATTKGKQWHAAVQLMKIAGVEEKTATQMNAELEWMMNH